MASTWPWRPRDVQFGLFPSWPTARNPKIPAPGVEFIVEYGRMA